ncbi:MAG: amidohydrolase family protein [Rhabdochlamydiaceae bacterium]|nr:amidohydrolase family protein [Candidatus Amphrikana amoebophyrae]
MLIYLDLFFDRPIILNHLGWPLDPKDINDWCEKIAVIAKQPNVSLKLSGFGGVLKGDRNLITEYIRIAYDFFGEHRLIFGSNTPPDILHLEFDNIIAAIKEAVMPMRSSVKERIFYLNAMNLYRLEE